MGQKVIDMSKVRMDFNRDMINAGTLKILDQDFFKPTGASTNGIEIAVKKVEPQIPKCNAEALGFGFEESDEAEEEKEPLEKQR